MSSDPGSAEVLAARVAALELLLAAAQAETVAANARADQLAGMVEGLLKVVTELEARKNEDVNWFVCDAWCARSGGGSCGGYVG